MRGLLASLLFLGACTEPQPDPHRPGDPIPEMSGNGRNGQAFEDRDGDGVDFDQCPGDPEDKDGFLDTDGCPDPDDDRDGIPDGRDRCPIQPGNTADGCPVDDDAT